MSSVAETTPGHANKGTPDHSNQSSFAASTTTTTTTTTAAAVAAAHNNKSHSAGNEPDTTSDKSSGTRIYWSDALRSDNNDSCRDFSPSLTNSHHGWALIATMDRLTALNRISKRLLSLLLQVCVTYDQFATAILKAGQSLNSMITTTNTTTDDDDAQTTALATMLQEAMVFWSGETSHLSRMLKTKMVDSWQKLLQVQQQTLMGIHEKYTDSRRRCQHVRQRALRARESHGRALLREAQAVQEYKERHDQLLQSNEDDDDDDDDHQEDYPPAVQSKVFKVQQKAAHFVELVEFENECVEACDMLEAMALETLQTLEEDRIAQFTLSVVQALSAEKHALQEVLVSTTTSQQQQHDETQTANSSEDDSIIISSNSAGNKKKKVLAKFRPGISGNILYEEGSGIMDAETLGLPAEVGQLRETIRSRIACRSTKAKTFRVLAVFMDYVATSMERFSVSMMQIVRDNNSSSSSSSSSNDKSLKFVHDEMKEYERSNQLYVLLGGLIRSLGVEAEEAAVCAKKLRTCRSENLDARVFYGNKLLKPASDSEELVWKQLCEAARAQAKAEDSYRQTTAQQQKARVRVKSVDSSKPSRHGDSLSPSRVSKHIMSKSLASMFSVLPNGGENAMKILAPETVASIVQHNLDDADEKEVKGRMALDSAIETTARFVEKYKKNATSWMEQFDSEDQDGWHDMQPVRTSFSEAIRTNRYSILKTLEEMDEVASIEIEDSSDAAVKRWACELERHIPLSSSLSKDESDTSSSEVVDGYKMLSALETSCVTVRSRSQKDLNHCSIEEDPLSDDERQESEMSVEAGSFTSKASGSMDEAENQVKQLASSSGEENQAPNYWLRLPTIPTNGMSDSFRGKLSSRKAVTRSYKRHVNQDRHTQILLTYFASDQTNLSTVITSFSHSCRLEDESTVSHYGRMFLLDSNLVLASWMGDNLVLKLSDDVSRFDPVLEDAIRISYSKGQNETQSQLVVGSLRNRNEVFDLVNRLREDAKARLELEKEKLVANPNAIADTVPPDETLSKMEVVVHKHLRNVSIQRFYELAWSAGPITNKNSIYQVWLEKDAMDVRIGQWEVINCTGPWDNERYQQKRIVNFKVQRKTHLYIGPPIANVQQTQLCRVEGQDKCVAAMTAECIGIPYGDTFAVEVRWVATRTGINDILVQVGVFTRFKKPSLFQGKIRSGTLDETTPVVESLFEQIKQACLEAGGEEVLESKEESRHHVNAVPKVDKATKMPFPLDRQIFRRLLASLAFAVFCYYFIFRSERTHGVEVEEPTPVDLAFLVERINKLETDIKLLQETLNEVLALLKNQL